MNDDHGKGNAQAHMESLQELHDAYHSDAEEHVMLRNGGDLEGLDRDELQERIYETPLSVETRSGWRSPGTKEEADAEYRILLTTGGPACQIVGTLDVNGEPDTASLQYCHWGTSWTNLYTEPDQDEVLLWFAQQFIFDY